MSRPELDFDPRREERELREYLGGDYDHRRLQRYERQLEEEFEACGDEEAFYRTSNAYLYNLTAFAMTGTKLPYLRELTRLVPVGSRLLDYGCGIGSDGLLLLAAGYRVEFADYDNPSLAYLRWRLRRRGFEAPVHDLDLGVPGGYDCAYAFDVIEHVADPLDFLDQLEARAALVVVNLLEAEPGETRLHHRLPIRSLLDHAAQARLRSYRIHHRRSHLVAYAAREGPPSAIRRLAGRVRLAWGGMRR